MKIKYLPLEIISAWFFTGYLKASGTFATIATIPFALFTIYLEQKYNIRFLFLYTTLFFTIISIPISSMFENIYGHKDPHKIVIDEVVGYYVTILVFSVPSFNLPELMNPANKIFYTQLIIMSFLLFRFFDIVKVFPANVSQKLKGGWGIVIDDVIAGIYSGIVLKIIIMQISS
ncbi:MAG TPA: phosphatidylglycerophosphatase A [bacterium]|nr:phosphatidylglycerophosphatase A [bacterium]HPN31831.1 phosphatidylglycerophosphatase A [bacterium]